MAISAPTEEVPAVQLTRLRGTCADTEVCPTVYRTDRNSAVIQGYLVTDSETLRTTAPAAGETAVEVPAGLITGLGIDGLRLHFTERRTVLVRGAEVTDPEALATLSLPVGESAVEVPVSVRLGLTTQEASA
ncbi:MAG: hypothetical protein LC799_23290 [Actinobacteria bacterium]|nr:hypothetical protein [Actinomycetota bacterium]